MKFLLDTSILIDVLRKKIDVIEFIRNHQEDSFVTSSACVYELWSGVYRLPVDQQKPQAARLKELLSSLGKVVRLGMKEAAIAGSLYADLAKTGTLIDDIDILIAATSIARNATLVTRNSKHFSRIKSLDILTL